MRVYVALRSLGPEYSFEIDRVAVEAREIERANGILHLVVGEPFTFEVPVDIASYRLAVHETEASTIPFATGVIGNVSGPLRRGSTLTVHNLRLECPLEVPVY